MQHSMSQRSLLMAIALFSMASSCEAKEEVADTAGSNQNFTDVQVASDGLGNATDVGNTSLSDATVETSSPVDTSGQADLVDPDGSSGGPADDCTQTVEFDVPVYPGEPQVASTQRPCNCFLDGTTCYLWGDASTPPLVGPDEAARCPADEACSGWRSELVATPGFCVKRCYNPEAHDAADVIGLACGAGEYCRAVEFQEGEFHFRKHGLCAQVPPPRIDRSGCPEPTCSPKDPGCDDTKP